MPGRQSGPCPAPGYQCGGLSDPSVGRKTKSSTVSCLYLEWESAQRVGEQCAADRHRHGYSAMPKVTSAARYDQPTTTGPKKHTTPNKPKPTHQKTTQKNPKGEPG